MNSVDDLPDCSTASADSDRRFTLGAWIALSLLGVFALLANTPAPRRLFLLLSLLACSVEWFRHRPERRCWSAFLPWIAVVLASVLWSPLPKTTAVDALWEVLSPIAAGLLAMSLAARVDRRYFWLPFVLLAGFALPCVLGALHVHAGFWAAAPKFITAAYAGRGVASTAGVLLSLIGGAVIAINWRTGGRWRYLRVFLGIYLLTVGVALGLLGNNRMYWFALCVGLLPWLRGLVYLPRRMRLTLGAGLLSLVLAGVLYSSYFAKVQTPLEAEQVVSRIGASYSADPRWIIWRSWLELSAEHPWLGYGYGTRILPRIGEKHIATGSADVDGAAQHHAHNVLINVLAQTGVVGLLSFLWALYGAWRLTFNGSQSAAPARVVDLGQLAAISVVLAALAKSMTDDFFWGPAGILMWLFFGIFAGMARPKADAQVSGRK